MPLPPPSTLLAQAESDNPFDGIQDGIGGLVEQVVPNPAAAALITGLVFVLLIVVVAAVLSTLARRGIRRMVERMKAAPETDRGWVRERMGLRDDDGPESLRRTQRAESLGGLATSVVTVTIWVVATIMILEQIGVQVGPLVAGAGIAGIALGFGAQDLVRDFLSGVFMLIEDQFGVGDIIDIGDQAVGVVEGISLRSTRVRDINGTLWHVPNGEIRRVGNMSQEWARSLLDVAVAYGTDLDAVSDLIRRVASEMSHEDQYRAVFMEEPEIWGVQALGADSVDIRLVIKTKPGEQWAISRELRRRLKNAFDAAGIEIPFAQRTVWLRTEQPVSFGDAETEGFRHPVPNEATKRRAVAASKRGDTGTRNEFAEMLPEEGAPSSPQAGQGSAS